MRCLHMLLVVLLFIVMVGCDEDSSEDRYQSIMISSAAIADNMIQEDTEQPIVVYLPPSYNTTSKKYPVMYFLHGHGQHPDLIKFYTDDYDAAMINGAVNEFIIVSVNGHNKLRGSFWVNSPVIGNWEDFVVKEVVPYVDRRFRTLTNRRSRGISGFSMGGFGSINLGLLHPDKFSVVYSLCPGVFDSNGLNDAMVTWADDQRFKDSYGAAFSPNIAGSYPYRDIPVFDGSSDDNRVVTNWKSGFGNLAAKIGKYTAGSDRLNALRIDYSGNDYYSWISRGSVFFSSLLTSSNISHTINNLNVGHTLNSYVFNYHMLPYFSNNFQFE